MVQLSSKTNRMEPRLWLWLILRLITNTVNQLLDSSLVTANNFVHLLAIFDKPCVWNSCYVTEGWFDFVDVNRNEDHFGLLF